MRVNEASFGAADPVEGYGPGFFRIGGEVFEGGLLVLPGTRRVWGGWEDTGPILEAADDIDVLFVGTGAEIAHMPEDFAPPLEEAGIGVEAMASAPACRTYNVALSEGRRIGLAVLPV